MSRIPASILNSCAPPNKSLLESLDSTACSPRNYTDYRPRAVCAVRAHGAQEYPEERPLSATETLRFTPFCCNTPTTGDATLVDDIFEKTHMAGREARTAGLKIYLDKIDQESHRSIECLRSTLQEVDRVIHALSPHALSPVTCSTGRHNAVCQCRGASRRFFYNTVFSHGNNRCSSPTLPDSYGTYASNHRLIQSDDSSVSSTSMSNASLPLRPSRNEKRLTSEETILFPASRPTHLGLSQQKSSSVPRKLETVFGGLSTIQHNTKKLCIRLDHAKKLVASRVSLEAHNAAAFSDRFTQSTHAERVPMKKALGFELLDDLEYSVKTAEELRMQLDQLEQTSRKRLNELYEEMQVRHKFKASPWQSKIKKPSPVLLRALNGLKNAISAQRRCPASVGEISNPGSHVSPQHGLITGLPSGSTTSSVGATGPANWLYDSSTTVGGKKIKNKGKRLTIPSFPLIRCGEGSTHCYPPDTSTLKRPSKTSHCTELKRTKLSDMGTEERRDTGHREEIASQAKYCALTPKHSYTTTRTISAASLIFPPSWSTKGAVRTWPQPRSRDLSSDRTAPQSSHRLSGQRNSSCIRDCACPRRFHFRHSRTPLLHASYNANDRPRNPQESSGCGSGQSLSTLPQSALCLGCERRCHFFPGTRLSGSRTGSSCKPSVDQHTVIRQCFFQEPPEARDSATITVSHSHCCLPPPGAGVLMEVSGTRQPPPLCGGVPVRRVRDTESRAARPLDFELETLRTLHAPGDLGLKTPQHSDGLSQSGSASVSCRLLPSPSPSIEHHFARDRKFPTDKVFGTYWSQPGIF